MRQLLRPLLVNTDLFNTLGQLKCQLEQIPNWDNYLTGFILNKTYFILQTG